MYKATPLKRVEQPLMRFVGKAEEVQVERAEEVRTGAILRALDSHMGRNAKDEEVEDMKEQMSWHSNGWTAARKGTN